MTELISIRHSQSKKPQEGSSQVNKACADRNKFPLLAVILLDLNMPRKSGFDVVEWLRSQPPTFKRISTIILTASMRAEDVEWAFDLGANSYLVKPTATDDLMAMIRCLRDWL